MPEPSAETLDRLRTAALALLPPGAIEHDGDLAELVEGAVVELARIEEDAATLLANRYPTRADAYLADWEALLGLPDPYGAAALTVTARQNAIAARLNPPGDHARARWDAVAAELGLMVSSVTYFAPFEAGLSGAGDDVSSDDWLHTILVGLSNLDGSSAAIDDLQTFQARANRDLVRTHALLLVEGVNGEPDIDRVVDGSGRWVIDGSGNEVIP